MDLRAVGSDEELALAKWQRMAEDSQSRLQELEMVHSEAIDTLQQLHSAYEEEQARAAHLQAEVERLAPWAQYSEGLVPAYEAAVQRVATLEEQLARKEELLAAEGERVAALTEELRLRERAGSATAAPQPTGAGAGEDPVSGLPDFHYGLHYLGELLALAAQSEGIVALARIDIHRLRDLNLFLGTSVSDEILRDFAARFRAVLQADQTLVRGRDDEFWLILSGTSGGPLGQRKITEQLTQTLQRMGTALKRPFDVHDHSVHLTLSCGIAWGHGGEAAGELLECAGLALESSKNNPGSRLVYYEPKMQEAIQRRMARVPLLREAVEREEFELFFQPMVELETLRIQGVESLLRWNHPTDGQLSPGEFIEAALESGVIVGIGEWVAKRVCQLSQAGSPYLWSLNVSAQELVQAHFMRRLGRAIEAAKLEHPQFLVVEISESGLAGQSERLLAALKELRRWKVQIAIDDFSFEAVSLRRLAALDISYLKISPELTRGLDSALNRNLVLGAVLAAEGLGCRVVAEGIEEQEQLERLRELGCHWGQGHLLQPPAAMHEIRELLQL
jgi:EAL domain-containing protein (putative c-di-GMP-specific phosphodiesterase class I)/GGDEF domain-containing protein